MTAPGSGLATGLLRTTGLIGVLLLGVVAAIASDTKLGLKAYAAVAGVALVAWAVVTQRERLALVFFLLVMFVEEFLPGLVVEDRTDRQLTILYGLSFLRVPGVYPVDVLLGGLLALSVYRAGAVRRSIPLLGDRLFLPLALTAGWIGIAAGISMFVFPDTTTPEAYNFHEIDIGLTKRIALLVPYMQFKIWTYVYLAYALARIHLKDGVALRDLLRAAAAASAATIAIAAYRFLMYRVLRGERGSLIYDDASLFVLTLTTCFILLAWGRNLYPRRTMFWQGLIVVGAAGVIALSSRRATTISFGLCIALVFLFLPNRFKARAQGLGEASERMRISADLDAGINDQIGQIRQDVHHDHEGAHHQGRRHDHRIVAYLDRVHQQQTHAGPVEDALDKDGSADCQTDG